MSAPPPASDTSRPSRQLAVLPNDTSVRLPSPAPIRRPNADIQLSDFYSRCAALTIDNSNFDPSLTGFPDTSFLTYVPHIKPVSGGEAGARSGRFSHLEWSYGQRWNAQRVLPFMYLGPFNATKDRDWLIREKISLCIAVCDMGGASGAPEMFVRPKVALSAGVDVMAVDVSKGKLVKAFGKAIELINGHMTQQMQENDGANELESAVTGRVLVYCLTGNGSSAAVVAAYIMAMYSVGMGQVEELVQECRFSVSFTPELRQSLLTWEELLKAKRDVVKTQQHRSTPAKPCEMVRLETANHLVMELPDCLTVSDESSIKASSSEVGNPKLKRGLDSAAPGGEENGQLDDRERFMGREAFKPFSDVAMDDG